MRSAHHSLQTTVKEFTGTVSSGCANGTRAGKHDVRQPLALSWTSKHALTPPRSPQDQRWWSGLTGRICEGRVLQSTHLSIRGRLGSYSCIVLWLLPTSRLPQSALGSKTTLCRRLKDLHKLKPEYCSRNSRTTVRECDGSAILEGRANPTHRDPRPVRQLLGSLEDHGEVGLMRACSSRIQQRLVYEHAPGLDPARGLHDTSSGCVVPIRTAAQLGRQSHRTRTRRNRTPNRAARPTIASALRAPWAE